MTVLDGTESGWNGRMMVLTVKQMSNHDSGRHVHGEKMLEQNTSGPHPAADTNQTKQNRPGQQTGPWLRLGREMDKHLENTAGEETLG